MLTESARILARRWVWAATSLVLALILGIAAYAVVPASQDMTATVLFVPPSTQPGVVGRTNPFYSLGGSTLVMTTVVQVLVNDDTTATRLTAQGHRAKYEVAPNLALNAGPTLLVKVTDKSASMAQDTMTAVLAEVEAQLKAVQVGQGVTSNLLITSVQLNPSQQTIADHKNQIQAGAITTVGTVFLLFALILLLERRRMARQPDFTEEPDETEPDGPAIVRLQQQPEPTTGPNLVGPRSTSRRAHRKAPVSLNTRRRVGRTDRPSSFGR